MLVAFTTVLFTLKSLGGLAALGLVLALAALRASITLGFWLGGLQPLLPLMVLTALYHLCLTPGTALWGPLPWLTLEGCQRAVMFTLRLSYLALMTSLLSLTTSPIALCDGVEMLLSPLALLRIPTRELALVSSIALRFVPTLALEAERIMKAQLARGAPLDRGNPLVRARAYASVLVPLFVRAFRYADELAAAMESRGYRGGRGRTRLRELRLGWRDAAWLGATLLLLAGLAWLDR